MAIVEVNYLRDPATGQVLYDLNGYPQIQPDPTANTYGQLQTRVQYEVQGSPTTTDVQNAIQDAIGEFERTSFYFNNVRYYGALSGSLSDLQTVAGKEFYSNLDLPVLVNYPHITKIMVLAFANRYPLIPRTPQWIDDQSISTSWQGLPTDWCWENGSLRLYPVPNGGYPLILEGTVRFAPMVNQSDFSVWTNRAERLIRCEAKRLLFREIARDDEQAQAMELEVYGNPSTGRRGELSLLQAETMRRAGGPGSIRPSRGYF